MDADSCLLTTAKEPLTFVDNGEQKPLGGLSPNVFLVVNVPDVITPLKFGDDRFRGFGLAKGQNLPFPIDFEGRLYNSHSLTLPYVA